MASYFPRIDAIAENATAVGNHAAKGGQCFLRIAVGLHNRRVGKDLKKRVELLHVVWSLEHPTAAGVLPTENFQDHEEEFISSRMILAFQPTGIAWHVHDGFRQLAHEVQV